MTYVERAVALFHDAGKAGAGDRPHGEIGAEIFLKEMTELSEKDRRKAAQAIREHDHDCPMTSQLSELLVASDANPPSVGWIVLKSYRWNLLHGKTEEEALSNAYRRGKEKYLLSGRLHQPRMYLKAFAEEIQQMHKDALQLTLASTKQVLAEAQEEYKEHEDD